MMRQKLNVGCIDMRQTVKGNANKKPEPMGERLWFSSTED
jgi:hypothetical protein